MDHFTSPGWDGITYSFRVCRKVPLLFKSFPSSLVRRPGLISVHAALVASASRSFLASMKERTPETIKKMQIIAIIACA